LAEEVASVEAEEISVIVADLVVVVIGEASAVEEALGIAATLEVGVDEVGTRMASDPANLLLMRRPVLVVVEAASVGMVAELRTALLVTMVQVLVAMAVVVRGETSVTGEAIVVEVGDTMTAGIREVALEVIGSR
jgi:hypothetical protein